MALNAISFLVYVACIFTEWPLYYYRAVGLLSPCTAGIFQFRYCLLVLSADDRCKQFGPRSGLTKCLAQSGSKLFDTLMVLPKEFV